MKLVMGSDIDLEVIKQYMRFETELEPLVRFVARKSYFDLDKEDYFLMIHLLLSHAEKLCLHFYRDHTSNRKAIKELELLRRQIAAADLAREAISKELDNPTNPKIYYDWMSHYWSDERDGKFLVDDVPSYEEGDEDLPEFDSQEDFLAWFQRVRPGHPVFNREVVHKDLK